MTGRIWLGEHSKGNEYNKHNKEEGKWLPEILNMTGWKIVSLFHISTSLYEIGGKHVSTISYEKQTAVS
jgi:hypothetical protein